METSGIALLLTRFLGKVPAWVQMLLALGLINAAWYLLPRPLTTLSVFNFLICLSLLLLGFNFLRKSPRWRLLGGVLIGAGLAALIWSAPAINRLPVIVFGVAAGAALWASFRAARERKTGVTLRRSLVALTALGMVFIGLKWADIAAVLTAWAFGVSLVFLAVILVAPLPRQRVRTVISSATAGIAAVLVGGIVAVGLNWESQQAAPDDFYHWDGDLPDTPGVLLRTGPYDGVSPEGAQAVRMLYTTTDVQDQIRVASAVVAIPDVENGMERRPVLAWQHGTTGVSSACAPSVSGEALTETAIPGIDRALARGWIVVATDYPGQGTAGPYPYMIGIGEGRAALDAVRAAQQISEANASEQVLLWGHSQGGHATLWAAELAPSYAPELEVKGVAALSAAADPYAMATTILSGKRSPVTALIFSYVLHAYADGYPDVIFEDYVDPAGTAFLASAVTRCASSPTTLLTVISALAVKNDRPLYEIDLTNSPAGTRLRENTAEANFTAPLFLGQGDADEVISIDIQRALAARLVTQDRPVEVREYPGKTHMGVIAPGAPLIEDLYQWADGVMAD